MDVRGQTFEFGHSGSKTKMDLKRPKKRQNPLESHYFQETLSFLLFLDTFCIQKSLIILTFQAPAP